jgi:uncharacterized protein (TIGR02118 family)
LVKFVALYRKPDDVAAFESWYLERHLPICQGYPEVEAMEVGRVTGSPRGDSEFHWIFTVTYRDQETMMKSLMSEAGMASAMDARESGFGKLMTAFFVEAVE